MEFKFLLIKLLAALITSAKTFLTQIFFFQISTEIAVILLIIKTSGCKSYEFSTGFYLALQQQYGEVKEAKLNKELKDRQEERLENR